jgi:exopolysaccharide production protein ExoZ
LKRAQIYGLDLIRFGAAFAVLIFHLGFNAFSRSGELHKMMTGEPGLTPWSGATWWGWIGVQIFFVISGLVIAYSAQGAAPWTFARHRIARLLPAMLISATLIAVVVVVWEKVAPQTAAVLWLKSVTFFPFGPWLSGQFWTLPVEIVFYGLVWLMIIFKVVGRLEVLAWVLTGACLAYWIAHSFGLQDNFSRLTQLALLQSGCYFALGIMLTAVGDSGLRPSRVLTMLACCLCAWLQISATAKGEMQAYVFARQAWQPYLIWLAAVAVIGLSVLWRDQIARRVGRTGGLLRAAGLVTYPLYLSHVHTGGPVLIMALQRGINPVAAIVLACIASIAMAAVIALVLEPPLHRLLTFVLKGGAKARPG